MPQDRACNERAGTLSAVEKIRLREELHGSASPDIDHELITEIIDGILARERSVMPAPGASGANQPQGGD